MLKELASARPDLAAVYRSPGLGLNDLLHELHAAGVLALGHVPGKQAFHYSARPRWLQPYARRGAAPPTAARLVPLPPPPPAQPAVRQHAAGGSVQVTLQPPAALGKPRVSRANAYNMLKTRLARGFRGGCCLSCLPACPLCLPSAAVQNYKTVRVGSQLHAVTFMLLHLVSAVP